MQVCNAAPDVVPASQTTDSNSDGLTDLYIGTGKIGQPLYRARVTRGPKSFDSQPWSYGGGEAEGARVTLKAAGGPSVRAFLRERFGVVTGTREYWHRENWTPDRADLQEFLGHCARPGLRGTARL